MVYRDRPRIRPKAGLVSTIASRNSAVQTLCPLTRIVFDQYPVPVRESTTRMKYLHNIFHGCLYTLHTTSPRASFFHDA
jgi:hypothetical protein